jgi:NADH:ubiquinone oxidoreductase subunit 3 (subunit A)
VPIVVTGILFIFWVAMAYRQLQRGDTLLAAVFLAVGVVLTIYRVRLAKKKAPDPGSNKAQ